MPGFPVADAQALFAELGYHDDMMVAAEPFHLFAIEAPEAIARQLSAELPLEQAGLQVVWTQDLTPFRVSKVRVLNGAHTSSALAAFGAGLNTVLEMTQDATLSRYLEQLMFDEIVPFVPLPSAERDLYARTILERFANPHIRHELISISLNSVSKWQVRVLPTVHDYARRHGKAPPLLSFSLAALLHFYTGKMAISGEYLGERNGESYPIRDTTEVIAAMVEAFGDARPEQGVAPLVHRILGDTRLWREDLNAIPGLAERVSTALDAIRANGIKGALRTLM